MLGNAGHQRGHVGFAGSSGEIAIPQRHVEGRMLAAHETCDMDAVLAEGSEREQRERTPLGVVSDSDAGRRAFAGADLALPCGEEIEALIGRVGGVAAFQLAPDGFGLAQIRDDVDGRKAARLRPVARLRSPAIERRSHGHLRHLSEIVYNFRLDGTFAGKCQQRVITMPRLRGLTGYLFWSCEWRRKTGS